MQEARNKRQEARFFLASNFLLLSLSIATYQRNMVWRDELTLWEDVIKKSSNKARGYNNVGYSYSLQGKLEQSVLLYKTALRLQPDNLHAHINLGADYSKLGNIDGAFDEYKTALRLNPDNARAHYNIGYVYEKKGLLNEAISEYKAAIKLKPDYVPCRHAAISAMPILHKGR